ncbi:hypothetical protein Nepgr_032094 [Nepenthes gracilis]|uniref:Reverse transcriptase domain-containing protein n=1 Tax=Nepenthes gracilis TaxID=150966 RepID=A0AAD3TJD2_NEPGR|nr:hypothetical protein Nepgr_032094 [Nepenthes gracilis]
MVLCSSRRVNALSRRLSANISILSLLHSTLSGPSSTPPTASIKTLTKTQLKTLVLNQYKLGKFSDLIRNVVASTSVLLTACQNLSRPLPHKTHDPISPSLLTLDSVSNWFDLRQLAHELAHDEFDPKSCCLRLPPSRRGGESLVLASLKLKVVIEAVRMVLEIIYDGGFATFVYGGRVGMGRHTAIRYLKNSVENPAWWFTVVFSASLFDSRHVRRLCSVIAERIDDKLFIGLIERFFESGAVRIELGSCLLGRGLPQESGLCSILINIYFNRFDKKIQEIRLQINQENSELDANDQTGVFCNPVKIYAIRYLDEMLMATSGSKMLAMDLKNWVLKYLEDNLELKVDRSKTAIHSAVSEKIDFLGMELQAVSPSVLHPPLSEKAKRARKKYLRQKEVRALELKNRRETNRKKLGMKIFSHVFNKLKRSNGFKLEYHIQDEVREIFTTWAKEVVQEFFGSLEERQNWHRDLRAGDFLSLKRIRDQFPQELIDAYDKFQEQVDKHLSPVKVQMAIEEDERRAEEEEERKYTETTVEDLTKLCMKVSVPIELVRKAVKMVGFTNNMGRPRPITLLTALEDDNIIKWYAGIGRRWLEFFSCCRNFKTVKTIVTYHLRFSCLLTLAEKHEATKLETIRHYTKDLRVFNSNGNEEFHFPTELEIRRWGDNSLSDPKPVDGALTLFLIRLVYDEPSYTCLAHFCDKADTAIYRVWLLQNRLNVDPMDKKKWVYGMGAIHESLNGKCFPLCADHISELYQGRISLQDIDCTAAVDVD